jgi:1,2-diacylglycerol 3-beta-galactosyltransferase
VAQKFHLSLIHNQLAPAIFTPGAELEKFYANDLQFYQGPRRVLVLMSDTGGGHRAAAEAIQEALTQLYGSAVAVTIVDAWKNHVAWPINRMGDSYSWIVNRARWLWKSFWLLQSQPALLALAFRSVYPLIAPGLLRLFKVQQPHVIVSVHPLITCYPLMVLQQAQLNIPFVTVVTDLVSGYIFDYIPGQEEKNVQYVQDHQAGVYLRHPGAIASTLSSWFQAGNPTLAQLARQAACLAPAQKRP